jgi:translation initiation factor 5B
MIRQPIVAVMGHVDHGKTSLLDAIRGTGVAKKEAGFITQHVGASELPAEIICDTCRDSMAKMGLKIKVPGLLFIDTPGHESFMNLRERGGSIADIAVLVVDVMQGFQPQTLESIRILRQYKTPFIVAANKIDLVHGWRQQEGGVIDDINTQSPQVQAKLEELMYELVGRLYEHGMESERFDRVKDFTKQIVIVPCSAKTKEGIPELLLLLTGLSQRFLEEQLKTEVSGPAKGTILEVKEERGLGTTIDVIIYDGTLKKNDNIIFGTINGAKETKVRALLKPKLPSEIKDPKDKFKYIDEANAASGVKVFAPGLEEAVPGSPLLVATDEQMELSEIQEISEQIKAILFNTQDDGVVVKADTLGSSEALIKLLQANSIPVRSTGIGQVERKDIVEASLVRERDKYAGAVVAFNVPTQTDAIQEAENKGVPIFSSNIIYALIDKYNLWLREEKEKDKKAALCSLPMPVKIKALPGCCFRASKPAIFGIEVLEGRLRTKVPLMTEKGEQVGEVRNIQAEKESVEEATKGMQVAISIEEAFYGKNIFEGDILYTYLDRKSAALVLESCKDLLTEEEKALVSKILKLSGNEIVL